MVELETEELAHGVVRSFSISGIAGVVVLLDDESSAICLSGQSSMKESLLQHHDTETSMALVADRLAIATMTILHELALVLHVTTCPFVLDASPHGICATLRNRNSSASAGDASGVPGI